MTLVKRKELQTNFQGIKIFYIENNFKKKEEEKRYGGRGRKGMTDLRFNINLCCQFRNTGILRVCFPQRLESLHISVLELNYSDKHC